jgi:hypothetical protein
MNRERFIDERDSHHLLDIVERTANRLKQHNLPLKNVLADGGFGSGINGPARSVHRLHAMLESYGITAYIPLQGSYHPVREGFSYDALQDVYLCSQGKQLTNRGIRIDKGYANYFYRSKPSDCKECPVKKACVGKHNRQNLAVTAYRNHYQRMQQRLESRQGKRMKRLRMATVEPVFGSLINYYGMWRANARGKGAAHKIMLMAACAYNLQKLLKGLTHPRAKAQVLILNESNNIYFVVLYVVPQPRTSFIHVSPFHVIQA